MNPQDYIISEPHSKNIKDLFYQVNEELLKPFPATPLLKFPNLTNTIGGFRLREFTILCGATGIGKTTLMANISRCLVEQQVPHFVASVETGATDFAKRVFSAMVGEDWNTGEKVPPEKLSKFAADYYSKFIKDPKLYLSLYEDRFSVETLMSDIAYNVINNGVKVAIIDNLNFFMEITKSADTLIEMDRVIHSLIIFCKRVDVHLIMVMHPKKTDNTRVESEFDVRGSSLAVQESHNVLLFNRCGEDLIESGYATFDDRELKIAKMRRKGRAVGARIILKSSNGVEYTEGGVVKPHGGKK